MVHESANCNLKPDVDELCVSHALRDCKLPEYLLLQLATVLERLTSRMALQAHMPGIMMQYVLF